MKPVGIFRHAPIEGPGYFATYLARRKIPWRVIRIDAGEAVPQDPCQFSGLVFMGGPMSVNDDLPWIPRVLALIRAGADADVPVLGHCLGGQLIAKALGGAIGRNPLKEIGWGRVEVLDGAVAREWFGNECRSFVAFHWHGERFTIPEGAVRVLASPYCDNQGFALGRHLALQCHVEMTRELIESWCESGAREIERNLGRSPAVQPVEEISTDIDARLAALYLVADRIYDRWTAGLKKQ
ncbi:MAG: type 1 glutamine amidotransferase [Betaproteobacteria bacterium]|nr:type 1 glutamine amidotransferase [Betaproteobacteria bacterium]